MVYISIESRKGGVGKTTVALTMADVLLRQGYQVLLFDMDIIGTTLDSSFLNSNNALIHEVKWKGKAVNLVHLFKNLYLSGKNIPSFAIEGKNYDDSFSFALDKCNYIGSNIYETIEEIPEDNDNHYKKSKQLEDPRILYDAFHAYWLLDFVKGISKSFSASVGKDSKVAVILDNSPGFSSIENIIHDYLTDLGPDEGKVLLVSTIDPQDIEACRQSKSVIETLFNDKEAAGKYYRSMLNENKGEKIDSDAFSAVWNSLCASDGRQPIYHSQEHDQKSKFLSILVNKVPQSIFEQLYGRGILHRDYEEASPFQNHLLYYFSNPLLTEKGIKYEQKYLDLYEQYCQSGKYVEIEKDNNRYLEFCKFSRQIGLGDFFKEEWKPLTHFNDLRDIMEKEEALKEKSNFKLNLQEYESDDNRSRIEKEVDIVRRFVQSNIRKESRLQTCLPHVVEFVSSILKELKGKDRVYFHPYQEILLEYEDFVTTFGLAVYRLHIYDEACTIFNRLIVFCLEDRTNIEKLNKDSIRSWIDDVLEGSKVDLDANGTLNRMLDDRMNARELSKALQEIIKSWNL